MRYEHNLATGEINELPDLPPTVPSAEELAAMRKSKLNAVRVVREAMINRINGIAARLARAGNQTILAIGDATVVALLALDKNLPDDPALVDAEVLHRYQAIVTPLLTTAPELVSAFSDMDA